MVASQPQYSPKQIADALEVSESSVKRWCDSGKISSVRTGGGHRRVTLEGLRRFLSHSSRSLIAPEVLGLPKLDPARSDHHQFDSEDDFKSFNVALSLGDEAKCRKRFFVFGDLHMIRCQLLANELVVR